MAAVVLRVQFDQLSVEHPNLFIIFHPDTQFHHVFYVSDFGDHEIKVSVEKVTEFLVSFQRLFLIVPVDLYYVI